MNGKITIENNPSGGTVFRVSLPASICVAILGVGAISHGGTEISSRRIHFYISANTANSVFVLLCI
jgi:hypothetical protein